MSALPPEIFKAYDIRGIVSRTLTPDIVERIGQGLGALALDGHCDTIAVGCDVKSTRNLKPCIERHGGKPLMWKTGHSLIKPGAAIAPAAGR